MRNTLYLLIIFLATILAVSGCAKEPPVATVYYGGYIYSGEDGRAVEAVVIEDGKFAYTGSYEGALRAAGEGCAQVDLQGKMMLPSFFEAHAHPNMALLLDLYNLPYSGDAPTPEEYIEYIREYLESHPDTQVLRGTGWDNAAFADAPPGKEQLDGVSTEIPIFIRSFDQHSVWMNSRAVEMGGAAQYGGSSGLLRDDDTLLVDAALPPISVEEHKEMILRYQNMAHSFGITGHMCALVMPHDNHYTAYRELAEEGKLSMYSELAIYVSADNYRETIEWLAGEAEAYEAGGPDELLGFKIVKFFIDGSVLGQTAYLLSGYAENLGYRGEPLWPEDPQVLADAFRLCEENGLRIHIHAIGDAAVKLSLDALEAAKTKNRHAITHLGLVESSDFARFSDMGLVAVINPYWFCKSAVWEESECKQLGRARAESMFPAKSFYDAGVAVASASDYPVSLPNPLIGMEMAVTRTLIEPWRGGRTAEDCTLNKSEGISIEQALDSFTLSAAYAYGLEAATGSIEAGKSADFIILDSNIFSNTPSQANVLETWFQGGQVFISEP